MRIWVDAQMSPAIASWITSDCGFDATAVRDLGLRDAEDLGIFEAARAESAVVLTKDRDFVHLLDRFGPPPQVLWLTCGNTSNAALERILRATLTDAMAMITAGEPMVEINSPLFLEP
jgi:predicted nuclease of predicted toxin-antitoxin system